MVVGACEDQVWEFRIDGQGDDGGVGNHCLANTFPEDALDSRRCLQRKGGNQEQCREHRCKR